MVSLDNSNDKSTLKYLNKYKIFYNTKKSE